MSAVSGKKCNFDSPETKQWFLTFSSKVSKVVLRSHTRKFHYRWSLHGGCRSLSCGVGLEKELQKSFGYSFKYSNYNLSTKPWLLAINFNWAVLIPKNPPIGNHFQVKITSWTRRRLDEISTEFAVIFYFWIYHSAKVFATLKPIATSMFEGQNASFNNGGKETGWQQLIAKKWIRASSKFLFSKLKMFDLI